MYREYEMLNKYTLECAVYSSGASRLPMCILRYDTIREQLFVQRFAASNLRIVNEVQHLLSFLDDPHWRDTVKHVQYRNGNLFESSDY